MSLRGQIALAVAAVAAVTTLAVGIASYRSTEARLYREVDDSLAINAPGPFAFPNRVDVDADGGIEIAVEPSPFPAAPPLVERQVVGRSGETTPFDPLHPLPVTARAEQVVGRPGRVVVDTVSLAGEDYRIRTVGTGYGAFQVARPLDETQRILSSLRTRTVMIVFIATVIGALLGSLIAGRVTAPLRRLTAAADAVGATGRLDVPGVDGLGAAGGRDEVGRLGSSFRAMLGSLARSQAEQRRLVEDAGHELKTPLTSIRTNLDVLRRHPELDREQRAQVLGELHTEVEEMVHLVEEVVAVAGGIAVDEPVAPFSLGDAAAEVVERFHRRTGRPIQLDADESMVSAQPTGVHRAISNLVDNAIKFDPSGAPIEVTVRHGRLDVSDRGRGVEPADAALVFERFHRGAAARSLPGSGLGLSIVQEVVDRNGGSVHVSPRPGGGTVIGFTLPAG